MATRTTTQVSTPSFIADPASITRSTGRQIDWANVSETFVNEATGKKELPAGLRVYETPSGKVVDEATAYGYDGTLLGILETNAIEGSKSAALSGYGVIRGGIIFPALLPEELDPSDLTELAAVGTGFAFETYADSRAS